MYLPNCENAVIPESKIVDYLLSFSHPDGWGKAIFFVRFGFSVGAWQELSAKLLRHASEHELANIEPTPFGTRYIIEGELETPDHRNPMVRSVWFVDTGKDIPRFVTAYPIEEEREGDEDDPGT